MALSWSYIPPAGLTDRSVAKETFDAKIDALTSFFRFNIQQRTKHNSLPVKLNLVEESIWPEARQAPSAQHTCSALIEIKWMSEGWMVLTELWNSREVQSHTVNTAHVCASVFVSCWVSTAVSNTFPVLISPSVPLNQLLFCYSSSSAQSTLTGLPFTSQQDSACQHYIISQYNKHKYMHMSSHKCI